MNSSSVVCLAVLLVAVADSSPASKDRYTTKYDDIDLEEVLNNKRLFNNYYKCLMDKGPCTPDGQQLKNSVKDALETRCSKCSERQKQGIEMAIKFLIEKKPTEFAALEKKYDPKGKFRTQYRQIAAQHGVKV